MEERRTVDPEVPIQVLSASSTRPTEGACSTRVKALIGAVAATFRAKVSPLLRMSTSYPWRKHRRKSARIDEEPSEEILNERVQGSLEREKKASQLYSKEREKQQGKRTRVNDGLGESVGRVDHDRSPRVGMLESDLDGDVGGSRESVEDDLITKDKGWDQLNSDPAKEG